MLDRAQIKLEAKGIMRTARVSPYIMTILVMAVVFVLDRVVDLVEGGSLFYTFDQSRLYYEALMAGNLDTLLAVLDDAPAGAGGMAFFSVLVSLFTVVLNGGYYIYCMGVRQGAEMPYSTLADGLSAAGKLIWCSIQMYVRIVLWAMLMVVPGIIAAYRYRFAYYNLLTDSSLSAGDAIRLSCQQTMGMKGQLFALDLSFIGWSILSGVTMGLLNIWLTPYMVLCDLAYFEQAQQSMGRSPYGGSQVPPAPGDPWGKV